MRRWPIRADPGCQSRADPGCQLGAAQPGDDQSDRSHRPDDAAGTELPTRRWHSNGVVVPAPGQVPISGVGAPGLDPLGPAANTFPLLGGDPGLGLGTSSLGAVPANTGGGRIIDEVNSAAESLGVGEAMDLFKGLVMPLMTSAMKSATLPAAPPVPAPPPLPRSPPHSPAPKRHRRSQVAGSAVPLQDIGEHFCRVETLVTTDPYVTSGRAVPPTPDAVHRDRGHRGDTAVGGPGLAVR